MRRSNDYCLVSGGNRAMKSVVDTRGAIDYHEIEIQSQRVGNVSETRRVQ